MEKGVYMTRMLQTHIVEGNVPWLFGKNTMRCWKAALDFGQEGGDVMKVVHNEKQMKFDLRMESHCKLYMADLSEMDDEEMANKLKARYVENVFLDP